MRFRRRRRSFGGGRRRGYGARRGRASRFRPLRVGNRM